MASPQGRILCTEGNADTRELLAYVLSEQGYEVICTESTDQAVSLAQTQHFDLYLIDDRLPDSTGPELTRRLRKFDIKTPVLFYSAAAFESDKEDARLAGAQGYLVKPVLNEDLINEVANLIAKAKIAVPVKVTVPDAVDD